MEQELDDEAGGEEEEEKRCRRLNGCLMVGRRMLGGC